MMIVTVRGFLLLFICSDLFLMTFLRGTWQSHISYSLNSWSIRRWFEITDFFLGFELPYIVWGRRISWFIILLLISIILLLFIVINWACPTSTSGKRQGKQGVGMSSNRVNVILAVYVEPLGKVSRSPWIFEEWRSTSSQRKKHT